MTVIELRAKQTGYSTVRYGDVCVVYVDGIPAMTFKTIEDATAVVALAQDAVPVSTLRCFDASFNAGPLCLCMPVVAIPIGFWQE